MKVVGGAAICCYANVPRYGTLLGDLLSVPCLEIFIQCRTVDGHGRSTTVKSQKQGSIQKLVVVNSNSNGNKRSWKIG